MTMVRNSGSCSQGAAQLTSLSPAMPAIVKIQGPATTSAAQT